MTSGSHELLVEGRPVWMSSINYRCAIDGGLVPCNSVHWHGTKTGRSFYFFYLAGYRCFFFLFSTKKKKGKSSQEVHPSWAAAKKADFRFGHTFVSASIVTRQRIQLNRHSAHCLPRPTRNFFPKTDNTSEIPRGHLFLPQLPCSTLSLIDSPSLAAIFHLGL